MGAGSPDAKANQVEAMLAGGVIRVRSDAAAKALTRAFATTPDIVAGLDPLVLDLRVDANQLDAAYRSLSESGTAGEDGYARHHRRGRDHAWVGVRPRQLQRLSLGGQAQAQLYLDELSVHDGAILARPAVDAISAWAASRGVMPLHASAIAHAGRSLLLVGTGGRGKTTTALAMALRGWELIADDRCYLSGSPADLELHSLYTTAIVTAKTADQFNVSAWGAIGSTHEGKIATRLPSSFRMAQSASLTAMVSVRHGVGEPYRIRRMGPREALIAWQEAFTPALQAHGPTQTWLATLAQAVRGVPAWQLTLGWDYDELDRIFCGLLRANGEAGR
jgi:hypothetical protein